MTIVDAFIIADTKATSNAAINITSKVRDTFLKSTIESAQDAAINTLNTTSEVDIESFLKYVRRGPKENYVLNKTKVHFYAYCCSYRQEKVIN